MRIFCLATVCLQIAAAEVWPASATHSDAPDRAFSADVEVRPNGSRLFIRNNHTGVKRIVWTGTVSATDNSVKYRQQRVAKLLWSRVRGTSGDRLLLLVTEIQRYRDVYDPDAIYVFSAQRARLLWSRVIGRRWEELVDWSPKFDEIVTVVSTVGPEAAKGDCCVVIDGIKGTNLSTVCVADLAGFGLDTVTGIQNARFSSGDVVQLRLYQSDSTNTRSYRWDFRQQRAD